MSAWAEKVLKSGSTDSGAAMVDRYSKPSVENTSTHLEHFNRDPENRKGRNGRTVTSDGKGPVGIVLSASDGYPKPR